MSSNFQQSIYRWILDSMGFHRVQEHPKQSSLLSSILILIFLPFTCSLFIYVFTIHYYVFHYSLLHISLFTITYALCTMYYALCTMHHALFTMNYTLCTMHYLLFIRIHYFICIHYFIRIHTYSLFHVTKSRDFSTYA